MKRTVKYLILAFVMLAPVFTASAQRKQGGMDWREKMRSEKIAFMTAEIGITPTEAEKFWPLYNEAEVKREESFGEVMKAYQALESAVNEKKTEKEINTLLQKYMEAMSVSSNVDQQYVAKYRKVLSAEKVAKLFLAEEKFRRQQIFRLQR